MIYKYPCLFIVDKNNNFYITFIDLASGIIPCDSYMDCKDAAIETIYELVTEKDLYPKDLLPNPSSIDDINLKEELDKLNIDYNLEKSKIEEIEIDTDTIKIVE